jgi:predicted transposase YbfD/YdcC
VYRPELIEDPRWVGVKSILCIERWGERQGKPYAHKSYAISSVATSASQWQETIREHWGIENRLHWPKDKVFGEDDYHLENAQALLNWSIFRTIVINLLRMNGFQSLKGALRKLANRVEEIFLLLK